ncbi:cobalamin biosynthesis protein CobG [Streptomyces sp. NPDC005963]|uniref:cobalamin biosynthesis protein CobG n=1 Tax=Streptomyces sp. NPDC005963 TaxID=3156721 RepID=UPI0033E298F6
MLADMPTSPRPARAGATGTTPSGVRGDACPGSLRLHRADDGALARIRIPGGVLGPAQAEALLFAAERLGDGELHLTSRGNVQLRGLGEQCGGELAQLLTDAGLLPSTTHERVRNVVASPLAGLDGSGSGSGSRSGDVVRKWLWALDGLLCGSPRAAALSGRFLFALDDGRQDVDALRADVTLLDVPLPLPLPMTTATTATTEGPAHHGRTAALRIGDTDDVLLLARADDGPRAALLCAETFLDAADLTPEAKIWRIRDLPDHGARLRQQTPARLADAGITVTGIRRLPRRETATPPPYGIVTRRPSPQHQVNGISEHQRGTVAPSTPVPQPPPDAPSERHRPANPVSIPVALSLGVPLGRLTRPQWEHLIAAARRTPRGELRLTPWRSVIVTGVPDDQAATLLATLATTGLITAANSPWTGVGACIGTPGCAKSLADVRAMASAVVSLELPTPARASAPLPIYWSGCERRCGRPSGDWVDALATPEGGFRVTRICGDPPPVMLGTAVPTDSSPAALAHTVAHARRPR